MMQLCNANQTCPNIKSHIHFLALHIRFEYVQMYQVSTLCIQNQGSSRIKQYSTVKSGTLRSLFYPLCKGFVEHEVRTLMYAHQCNVDNRTNVEPCEGKSAFFWLHVSLNQNRKLSEAAKSLHHQKLAWRVSFRLCSFTPLPVPGALHVYSRWFPHYGLLMALRVPAVLWPQR